MFFNRNLAGEGQPWGPGKASIRAIAVADLNGDGHPDLIVGYVDAPGLVYYNDGTGRNFDAHPFGDGKGAIYGMASGDLDGDGGLDLVAARSDAPSFILFSPASK